MKGSPMVPYLIPNTSPPIYQFMDVFSRLYRDRILVAQGFITEEYANNLIAILLYLQKDDPKKPVTMYCNLSGGFPRPSLALYDTMRSLQSSGIKIVTLNLGFCAGMGSFIVAAGDKGSRFAMPNSILRVSRPSAGGTIQGQAEDIGKEVANVLRGNARIEKEMATMTGQTPEKLRKDLARNFYLDSGEAVEYGFVDKILQPQGKAKEDKGGKEEGGLGEFSSGQKYGEQ